ncbi:MULTISPECIES: alpha/beta fold hydrolase [Paenibacillus]|uniref:alpha/beta fold hydrolase n=1 Tax=Paenibacillus TaxID=44249 RepID=UPI0022B86775|nr:alpha/beta hydrolase [Paenibacillus caseinilyticus]MCZ8520893.1 alpha/beta hydrolase [Paenibacillus caseinilyticus]
MGIPAEHKQWVSEEAQIHYFVSGRPEGELVLCLHPAFGDHRCFDGQLEAFASRYRVITVDLIGHGLSQVYGAGQGIDRALQHLLGILHAEGYDKCHLVGVSMGSLVAQAFASRYPDKVMSLVSVGAYSIREEHPEIVRAQRSEMLRWLLMAVLSMNRFRRYLASVTVIRPEQQERFYDMTAGFTRRSIRVLSGLRTLAQAQTGPAAASPPLLLVCGDRDLPVVKEATLRWQLAEPRSTCLELENAGHCANMDQPQVFNEVVLAFLNSVPSG